MWDSLIDAGTSLIGGVMKSQQQEKANAINQANFQASMAYQDLVNKNSIQWKVADAKAAGLHPLAALGVNTGGGPSSFVGAIPATGMAEGIAAAGQDISRAVGATRTAQKRSEAFETTVQALSLEQASLKNDLLRSQIARLNQQNNPAVPDTDQRWQLDGQGQAPQVKMKPFEVTPGEPGRPWMEPGAISDVGHARTPDGYAVVPSKEMQERIEDNWLASMSWMYRNQILPSLGMGREKPPAAAAPEGYEWRWHWPSQEYRPARRRGIWKEWK